MIAAGVLSSTVLKSHLKRVTVDTSVQEKAVSFPTDGKLHTYLGQVMRDIERKIAADDELQQIFAQELLIARRLLAQKKDNSNKLYSLHAPEVECISKAHKRYEFGVKASVAVTNRSNFAVGGMALPGSPYDGYTLKPALDQVRALSGQCIEEVFGDRGYRGHDETDSGFTSRYKSAGLPLVSGEF